MGMFEDIVKEILIMSHRREQNYMYNYPCGTGIQKAKYICYCTTVHMIQCPKQELFIKLQVLVVIFTIWKLIFSAKMLLFQIISLDTEWNSRAYPMLFELSKSFLRFVENLKVVRIIDLPDSLIFHRMNIKLQSIIIPSFYLFCTKNMKFTRISRVSSLKIS